MESIELRYSLRFSLGMLAFSIGCTALGFWDEHADVLLLFSPLIFVFSLVRLLDRRVRLRADARGLYFRGFGARTVPWSEIARFRLSRQNQSIMLDVIPRDPEAFRRQLPWYRGWGLTLLTRETFPIQLTGLDARHGELIAVLDRYVGAAAEKRPVAPVSGAGDARDLELPLAGLRFPGGCLGCQGEPTGVSRILVVRGLDLGWFRMSTRVALQAPTCAACRWRRRLLGAATWPVPILALAVLGYLAFPWLPRDGDQISGPAAFLLLGAFLAAPGSALRLSRAFSDRALWGVRGVRLPKGEQSVVLRVEDAVLRHALVELNAAGGAPHGVAAEPVVVRRSAS